MIGKFCLRNSIRWLGCWIARMGLHVRPAISVGIVLGLLSFPVSAQALLSFVEVQQDGVGGVDGLDYAYSVTVSPDGKNLYAAGGIDNAVAVFSRDTTTGELSFVEVQMDGVGGVDGLDGADSVTVSPDGKNLYAAGVTDDAVAVFSRNTTTGELSFVEVQMDGVGGVDGLDYARSVTVSPDGKNLYAAGAIDNAVTVFGINLPGNAMPWIPLLLLED
jgi:DNA-binding beta-propeller fold protein YncE